jgi:sigma-B regulation protein RsbU (phosphoserine phosphatase)
MVMLEKSTHKLLAAEKESSFEEHLQLVADITQEFARSLDIDETLDTTLSRIMHYMDAEAASIFLLENDDTELVCRASAGPVQITGLRLPAGKGIVGKTVQNNEAQIVRDVTNDPNFTDSVDEKTGFTTRSILCAPLAVKDRKLGAIELINKKINDGLFNTNDQLMLSALAHSASLAINNAAMAQALIEQERIQMELELAREIQDNLLPRESGAAYPVHGKNIPMREVSGDFFDHFMLDDGSICFNLADVSGKGMNAAMLMAKTSSLYHCLGKTIRDPAELFMKINNEIAENATRGMFVTMVGGIYNPATGDIQLANAGHHPPLLMKTDGSFEELDQSSIPLGILKDTSYETVSLNIRGSTLYIYTDGLCELHTHDGGELGVEGIQGIIKEVKDIPAAQRIHAIIARALVLSGKTHDDVTLLLIEGTGE